MNARVEPRTARALAWIADIEAHARGCEGRAAVYEDDAKRYPKAHRRYHEFKALAAEQRRKAAEAWQWAERERSYL